MSVRFTLAATFAFFSIATSLSGELTGQSLSVSKLPLVIFIDNTTVKNDSLLKEVFNDINPNSSTNNVNLKLPFVPKVPLNWVFACQFPKRITRSAVEHFNGRNQAGYIFSTTTNVVLSSLLTKIPESFVSGEGEMYKIKRKQSESEKVSYCKIEMIAEGVDNQADKFYFWVAVYNGNLILLSSDEESFKTLISFVKSQNLKLINELQAPNRFITVKVNNANSSEAPSSDSMFGMMNDFNYKTIVIDAISNLENRKLQIFIAFDFVNHKEASDAKIMLVGLLGSLVSMGTISSQYSFVGYLVKNMSISVKDNKCNIQTYIAVDEFKALFKTLSSQLVDMVDKLPIPD